MTEESRRLDPPQEPGDREAAPEPGAAPRRPRAARADESEVTIVLPAEIAAEEGTASGAPGAREAPEEPDGMALEGLAVTEICESRPELVAGGETPRDLGSEREPTVILDSLDGPAAPESGPDGEVTEEMLVVLPEELAGEIPVVETEEVEGEAGAPQAPGPAAETAENVALCDANPCEEFDTEEAEPATRIVGEEGLEALASDLDDDLLAETTTAQQAGASGELVEEGAWEDEGYEDAVEPPRRRRLPFLVAGGLAAALLVAGGLSSYFFFLKGSFGPAEASASGEGVPAAVAGAESPGAPGTVVEPPGGFTPPVEVAAASRGGEKAPAASEVPSSEAAGATAGGEAPGEHESFEQLFAKKVQLALKLGYLGEASHE